MKRPWSNPLRILQRWLLPAVVLVAGGAAAQESVVVGIVDDGPAERLSEQQEIYIDELLALTAREFDVRIERFSASWSRESIVEQLDAAYTDPDIDLVLVLGFVANQIAATRDEFPKPTFLPLILESGLLNRRAGAGRSGVANVNYLSAYADFSDDLDTLSRVVVYRKLALFVDSNLSSAIPELRQAAFDAASSRGIDLVEVPHDGVDHHLLDRVPGDTDAVFVAGLPRMPNADFERLIEAVNAAGIPSYSFVGIADVERGLLATNSEPRDVDRQARLNALNMQAVMLGERAEDQPTATQERGRLIINMATARRIGVSPSFQVMGEAVLINQDEDVGGDEYGLVAVARLALQQNQDLVAEAFAVDAGVEEIARARSTLLPQLDLAASYSLRRAGPSVAAGLLAERSTDAALTLNQLLYSDAARANVDIQRQIQRTRLAALDQFRLDIVLAATTSYYTVLNARSQLAVQENNLGISRANLQLAEDRVELGTSTAADVYRWQAEVARAQIGVLNARAAVNQSWETLNRLLHRPQGTRVSLRDASFEEPFIMTRAEFDQLVSSPADYAIFSRFYIDRALAQAPEIATLDAQIEAKRREYVSTRRAYWLPDVAIGGQYAENLGQSGAGAGLQAGENQHDWSVGLQATLPIFSGGLKRANERRAGFELQQLSALRESTVERVEENIRNQLHAAQAAYAQIDLANTAAEASQRNYELVSDAYARGTVSVIELLDAQETSLAASATAAESLYSFFITIMSVQRAVGGYDYLLSPAERTALADEFRQRMTESNR